MECLVVINEYSKDGDAFATLYKEDCGNPEYAGAELKYIIDNYPQDMPYMTCDVLCEELKQHNYTDDYDLSEMYCDEDEIDENEIQPYKYVYIIDITQNNIKYRCKRINAINFPSLEELKNYETIDTQIF